MEEKNHVRQYTPDQVRTTEKQWRAALVIDGEMQRHLYPEPEGLRTDTFVPPKPVSCRIEEKTIQEQGEAQVKNGTDMLTGM